MSRPRSFLFQLEPVAAADLAGHLQAIRRDVVGVDIDVHSGFAGLCFTQSYRREGGMSS